MKLRTLAWALVCVFGMLTAGATPIDDLLERITAGGVAAYQLGVSMALTDFGY